MISCPIQQAHYGTDSFPDRRRSHYKQLITGMGTGSVMGAMDRIYHIPETRDVMAEPSCFLGRHSQGISVQARLPGRRRQPV